MSIRKTDHEAREALSAGVSDIGGLARLFKADDRVLIKPNLNDDVCYTNKELVAALVAILRELGVSRISIGESTFGNATVTENYFISTGYSELAKTLGLPLVNFNASEAVEVRVKDPLVLDTVRIAKEAFEATKIVNMPVMKVHYATDVSLGLKNLKGFLVGREKRRFHEMGLDNAITDLANSIHTHLTIVDCIECMETMGPKGGDIKRLDTIIVGEDVAETDIIGCRVMGFDPLEAGHIRKYLEYHSISESSVRIKGVAMDAVVSPFKRADLGKEAIAGYEVHSIDACSTCMNALVLSLRFLETRYPGMVFYLGSKIETFCERTGISVSFGNCCSAKNTDIRVAGCPPYPFELNDKIKNHFSSR